jgi:UDP-glucose 4-epimerase
MDAASIPPAHGCHEWAAHIASVVTKLLCDPGHDVAVWANLENGQRAVVDRRTPFTLLDLLDGGGC